ncbi:hypothetical protein [Deinococcus misasensis]|uniref:hypothetical protein n=1 Tax=Deinococcus misasensis TaxID=392413 RepID=UPI00055220BB|nr:hypothetical protein [Deinococcus misasensis]
MADVVHDKRKLPIYVDWQVDDLPVTGNALRVYVRLSRRAQSKGYAHSGYKDLGEALRASYPTASSATLRRRAIEAIKELELLGLVRVETQKDQDGGNATNHYHLLDREDWFEARRVAEQRRKETLDRDRQLGGGSALALGGVVQGTRVVHRHQGSALAPKEYTSQDSTSEEKISIPADAGMGESPQPETAGEESLPETPAETPEDILPRENAEPATAGFSSPSDPPLSETDGSAGDSHSADTQKENFPGAGPAKKPRSKKGSGKPSKPSKPKEPPHPQYKPIYDTLLFAFQGKTVDLASKLKPTVNLLCREGLTADDVEAALQWAARDKFWKTTMAFGLVGRIIERWRAEGSPRGRQSAQSQSPAANQQNPSDWASILEGASLTGGNR